MADASGKGGINIDIDTLRKIIRETVKETVGSSRESSGVEREIKILSANIKTYLEKAQTMDPRAAFESLGKELKESIDDFLVPAKQKLEEESDKKFAKAQVKYDAITKQIEELNKQYYDELNRGFGENKTLGEEIKNLKNDRKKIEEDFNKSVSNLEKGFKKEIQEKQTVLLEELTTGYKGFGKEKFTKGLKESQDVDEALSEYKKALLEQYNVLQEDKELRVKLGVTESKLEEIKEELYDSYFDELKRQSEKDNLDKVQKKLLEDRIKRERIAAGRSTYEQTYGGGEYGGSAIAKLAGRMADYTTKRYKKQTAATSIGSRAFSAGLSAIFKGEETKPPFLETERRYPLSESEVEGGEGRRIAKTFEEKAKVQETAKKEAAEQEKQKAEDEKNRAELSKQIDEALNKRGISENPDVNPSAQTQAIMDLQQSFEEAKENVPFKVIVSDIETIAEKRLTQAFTDAIVNVLGPIIKEDLAKALENNQKKLLADISKKKDIGELKESKEEGGMIDVISDAIDLLPDRKKLPKKKGFLKKTAQRGRIARGAFNRLARRVPLGGSLTGGLTLGTNVGAITGMGAGAIAASGALAAGTAYAGYKAGEALEENFGLGTKTLEAVGVNEKENKLEKAQDELNGKLQDAAKEPDPTKRRIAFFEAQLENLEQQKTIQTGDEKAQTEKMITVVKSKLEKLKNPPKIEPAPTKPEIPTIGAMPGTAAPTATDVKKVAEGATAMPPAVNVPVPKDVSPVLDTNNKLTAETNQKLDVLIKVMSGKDYGSTNVAPVMVAQAAPSSATGQSQSPAYQFRSQNRVES